MIEIRYSAPHYLDISGTVDELQLVRREIFDFIQSGVSDISFDADSGIDPTPYASSLSKLVIRKGQHQTKVSLMNGAEIHVEGSPNCLEAFASFFDFALSARKGEHLHYEYYEGNEWVASDSMPLVISVK